MHKKWIRGVIFLCCLASVLSLLSACVSNSGETSNTDYKLYQTDDGWNLKNVVEIQAAEIRLGQVYASELITVNDGCLSLVKYLDGKTLIALVAESGNIKPGTDLLSIKTEKVPEIIDYLTVSSQVSLQNIINAFEPRSYPVGMSINNNNVQPNKIGRAHV